MDINTCLASIILVVTKETVTAHPAFCTSSYLTKSVKLLKSEKWLDRYHPGQGHNVEQKFIVKKYC